MNKVQRKELSKAIEEAQTAIATLVHLRDVINAMASDEREKYDNMSEGLQQSENGQRLEQNADKLDEWDSALQEAIDTIEGISTDDIEAKFVRTGDSVRPVIVV